MNYAEMTAKVFVFWWFLFPSYEPLSYSTIVLPPDSKIVGLVREEGRNRWWANDLYHGEIRYYDDNADPAGWEAALIWSEEGIGSRKPGPMAIDTVGDRLWVVVEEAETGYIRSYDTKETPLLETFPRIEIPPSARRRDPSITGLTYDGEYLWLVTDCGLCSTLIQFDPETGTELYDFFPACAARGIAYRPPLPFMNGKLWMIAYNGPSKRPLLTRRTITGDPSRVNTSLEHFAFVGDGGPPIDPTAIAVRGSDFWVADRNDNLIRKYSAGALP